VVGFGCLESRFVFFPPFRFTFRGDFSFFCCLPAATASYLRFNAVETGAPLFFFVLITFFFALFPLHSVDAQAVYDGRGGSRRNGLLTPLVAAFDSPPSPMLFIYQSSSLFLAFLIAVNQQPPNPTPISLSKYSTSHRFRFDPLPSFHFPLAISSFLPIFL